MLWCKILSRMAVAITGSPNISPHSLYDLFAVKMVDDRSYLLEINLKNRFEASWSNGKYPISSMLHQLDWSAWYTYQMPQWRWIWWEGEAEWGGGGGWGVSEWGGNGEGGSGERGGQRNRMQRQPDGVWRWSGKIDQSEVKDKWSGENFSNDY